MDWHEMFAPSGHLGEMVVRATIMFLGLFLALRFFLKRQAGEIGIVDILVIVLVSEAAQNALVGEAKSVTEAFVLVSVILFWAFVVAWASHRFPAVARFLSPPPRKLVENGRMNRRNMRKEFVTEDELMSHLRQQGVDAIEKVRTACLEPDGSISVVRADDGEVEPPKERHVA